MNNFIGPRPYRCKRCNEVCVDPEGLPGYYGDLCQECDEERIEKLKKAEGERFHRGWRREDARHGF